MKSTFGEHIQISLFGESHGAAIGVNINGLAPGIKLDLDLIRAQLNKRKPRGKISTQRQEADEFEIVSGFFNGYTTGTPLCIFIRNQIQHSKDYEATKYLMRPSHADYTAFEKYGGFQDYRGGGHFSGRITAPLVAAGAICLQILKQKGITIATHIASCKEIEETAIVNMPAGIGEPFFSSIESVLAHLLFSVPAVKGVEFGLGFGFANLFGSQANDPFVMKDKVCTTTNHNGGINGGISNGMPIMIKTAVKPTPSIYQPQQTVNIQKRENAQLQIHGRHDPAIIHRARVVVDSMVAIGLVDLFADRYGYMWMASNEDNKERNDV